MLRKVQKWWLFNMANPVIRKGQAGGFKWKFRRFWLEVETLSGNFKARWIAAEHPYAALVVREGDVDTHAFAQIIYEIGQLLTTDQQFADDIGKAIQDYDQRLQSAVVENETEEKIALEEMKQVQEVVDMPKKERRKYQKDVDRRFRKAVKEVRKNEG